MIKNFIRKLAEILERESIDTVQWTASNDDKLHKLYSNHIPTHKDLFKKYTAQASDIIKYAKRYAQYKTES